MASPAPFRFLLAAPLLQTKPSLAYPLTFLKRTFALLFGMIPKIILSILSLTNEAQDNFVSYQMCLCRAGKDARGEKVKEQPRIQVDLNKYKYK